MTPALTDALGALAPDGPHGVRGQPGEPGRRLGRAGREGLAASAHRRTNETPTGGKALRLLHFKKGHWEEADENDDE